VYYLDQPKEVSLETYTLCNAKCTFCPYDTLSRKQEKMSDELIQKVIDELATFEKPFTFTPFKVNEPLLDNRLFDICKEVERRTVGDIRLFTNGSPLSQKKIDQIADLVKVQHLWISLNSVNPIDYKNLMDLDFEKTAKKLDNLHSQYFPHPVVVSTVGSPNHEFVEYCQVRWPKFQPFVIKQDAWLGYTDSQITEVPDKPCGRWEELSIMSNGIVSLCCMDGEGQYSIGDINRQTLLEVYNSKFYRERREKRLSRKVVPVCNQCTY
jgi:sulfatase maturation enzyme AslB (radical SAM superfamily)